MPPWRWARQKFAMITPRKRHPGVGCISPWRFHGVFAGFFRRICPSGRQIKQRECLEQKAQVAGACEIVQISEIHWTMRDENASSRGACRERACVGEGTLPSRHLCTMFPQWMRRVCKKAGTPGTPGPGAPSPLNEVNLDAVDITKQERYYNRIQRLLSKCDSQPSVSSSSEAEDSCCVCLDNPVSVRAYPCGHKVACRRCVVYLIKNAVDENKAGLECVMCRQRIFRLRYAKPTPDVHVNISKSAPYEVGSWPRESRSQSVSRGSSSSTRSEESSLESSTDLITSKHRCLSVSPSSSRVTLPLSKA